MALSTDSQMQLDSADAAYVAATMVTVYTEADPTQDVGVRVDCARTLGELRDRGLDVVVTLLCGVVDSNVQLSQASWEALVSLGLKDEAATTKTHLLAIAGNLEPRGSAVSADWPPMDAQEPCTDSNADGNTNANSPSDQGISCADNADNTLSAGGVVTRIRDLCQAFAHECMDAHKKEAYGMAEDPSVPNIVDPNDYVAALNVWVEIQARKFQPDLDANAAEKDKHIAPIERFTLPRVVRQPAVPRIGYRQFHRHIPIVKFREGDPHGGTLLPPLSSVPPPLRRNTHGSVSRSLHHRGLLLHMAQPGVAPHADARGELTTDTAPFSLFNTGRFFTLGKSEASNRVGEVLPSIGSRDCQ